MNGNSGRRRESTNVNVARACLEQFFMSSGCPQPQLQQQWEVLTLLLLPMNTGKEDMFDMIKEDMRRLVGDEPNIGKSMFSLSIMEDILSSSKDSTKIAYLDICGVADVQKTAMGASRYPVRRLLADHIGINK